jgi:hypothetical protein
MWTADRDLTPKELYAVDMSQMDVLIKRMGGPLTTEEWLDYGVLYIPKGHPDYPVYFGKKA